MKALLKIMLTLAAVFATTFLLAKMTGILTYEKIEALLAAAGSVSPWYISLAIVALLFADLFIAVPTLTIIILAGYFLGPILGANVALIGLFSAGIGGYLLSQTYGEKLVILIIKDSNQRRDAYETFRENGFVTILLSRALPILPEVSACMAGLTRMPFAKFLSAWLISTIPYAFIAAYAGSISSLENPKPAILTAIGLSGFFWLCWFFFQRKKGMTTRRNAL